jgi:DHA3 family macrolide efflux protein-like MFS transporter
MLDSATYFISAAFLISIRLRKRFRIYKEHMVHSSKRIVAGIRSTFWGEMKEGIAYIKNHAELRFVISVFCVIFPAAGAVYVVIIIFIQKAFASITRDLGLIAVFLGIGLFCGALLYGKFGKRFAWYRTIFFCLAVAGAVLMLFTWLVSFYPNLFVAGLLAALLGLIIGPVFIAANTVVQTLCEESMRGKVFSALEIIIHATFLAAMLASSWLAHVVPESWILMGAGMVFGLVGILGWMRNSRLKNLALK